MASPSKDIYDSLLNDQRFWDKPVDERLEIVDFAANKYAAEDLPEEQLMDWSRNRYTARMVSKLGPDKFKELSAEIQASPEGSPLPSILQDPILKPELAGMSQLPYGQTISLDSMGTDNALKGLEGGVAAPQEGTVSVPGEDGIKLRFVPHPTKFLMDIETPEGIKRKRWDTFEEVPKSGEEMTRFLAKEYGQDFGITGGPVDAALSQGGAVAKRFASEAVRSVANVPNMLEATYTSLMMGNKGKEFAENSTIDSTGDVVPMTPELKAQLRQRGNQIWQENFSTGPNNPDAFGDNSQPTISIDEAFVRAHKEHLDGLGPIEVTGKLKPKMTDEGFDFTADDRFSVLERLKLAGNPNLPEGMSDRSKFLKEGDSVKASDLLAANIAISDAPKARELSKIWESHMGNIRAIDEVYGRSAEQTLRSSQDSFIQKAFNMQQDVGGLAGQMVPVIPLAIMAGPEAGLLARGAAAAPMTAIGYSGNMAESVGAIYQDQIQAGKGPRESIINAVEGGIASAAASAPVDLLGDMALGGLFKEFGTAYKALTPASQEGMAKAIAKVMTEAAGEGGRGFVRETVEHGLLQAASEFGGEFTRAQVADMYRDNPDGAVENAKQALYEGALALVATGSMGAVNQSVATVSNLWTDYRTRQGMDAAGYSGAVWKELQKLAPAERAERMKEFMGVKQQADAQGLPAPTAQGSTLIPERQNVAAMDESGPPPVSDEDRQFIEQQEQSSQAFEAAQPTTDEGEVASLTQLGFSPGDVVDYNGTAVKILGAPVSQDGNSVSIRGIDSNGQEVVLPEADVSQLTPISLAEGQADTSNSDGAEASPVEPVQLPPEQAAAPAAPASLPKVSLNSGKLGGLSVELSPETVNFGASSGISPQVFETGADGTVSFNYGKLPNSGRSFTVALNPPEASTTEGAPGPLEGPVITERDYNNSAAAVEQWARGRGHWLRGTAPLGQFMASSGLNPYSIATNEEWQAVADYTDNLPVVLIDGAANGTLSENVRIQRGTSVADGVVIPVKKWQSLTSPQKAATILHEVLHSAIGDWAMAASGDLASSEMKSTYKEMGELGENLLKSVKSAKTPEAKAFREHFSSIFEGPHYNPENSHELVEELLIRGLTDNRARAMLQAVDLEMKPIKVAEGKPVQSFWDHVVSLIRKALGWNESKPQLQSLFDKFYDLNLRINEQRSTITVGSRYDTRESAKAKAAELGLPKGSYTIAGEDGSFTLRLGDASLSTKIREAQRELDRNIALNWQLEEGETVSEQLQSRMDKIRSSQNVLAESSEVFFNSMQETTGITAMLTPEQSTIASDATYERMVQQRENNTANRFILRPALPDSILGTITDAGKQQEIWLRSVADYGMKQWEAGFRTFAAWKASVETKYPTAALTSLWDNLQVSIADTLQRTGANGTTSLRFDKGSPVSLARQQEYASFLSNPKIEGMRTFSQEAEQISKTRLAASSRAALFNYGPLAPARNRFLSIVKGSLVFDQAAFDSEYQSALDNPGRFAARLQELDRMADVVRETKERLAGVRKSKQQLQSIFTDVLSRLGIDKAGAEFVWRQVTFPGSINSPEMGAAIDGAIQRARQQFGLTDAKATRTRLSAKLAAHEMKKVFRRVNGRSPEVILDESRTAEVANAAKAKARYMGRMHGSNAAQALLTYGTDPSVLNETSLDELGNAYYQLVEGRPFDLESQPGFSQETLTELLGASLDATYLRSFITGARSAFLKQTIADGNNHDESISKAAYLWTGATSETTNVIGGVDFTGKDLFDGLIAPAFEAVTQAKRLSLLRNEVLTGDKIVAPEYNRDQRLTQLRDSYNFLREGDKDTQDLRTRLANEVSFYDPLFERSFDASALRFEFGMTNFITPDAMSRLATYQVTGTITPGRFSSILKDLQDLRGGLRTNETADQSASDNNAADFSNRSFNSPLATRDDRRSAALEWDAKQAQSDTWNLQKVQTKALLALAEGSPDRAAAIARLILSESVITSGNSSYDRVTELIEDQLTEQAGNENNAAYSRKLDLQRFSPRIMEEVPMSASRVRLALTDGGAEVVNMADLIDGFSAMDDSQMGGVLAGFLRGNTRPLSTLLIDTSRMNEESAQAFRQSALLNGQPSNRMPASESGAELLVVDVGQMKGDGAATNPVVQRVLGEAVRDALSREGTQALSQKASTIISALNEFAISLDHGLGMMTRDLSGEYNRLASPNQQLASALGKVADKWGGFENSGAIPLAIEVLTNPDFRQALALLPRQYFDYTTQQKTGVGKVIDRMSREVAASDLNEGARKHLDYGLDYQTLENQLEADQSFDEDFGNVGSNLDFSGFAERPSLPTFAEAILGNAMELLWTSTQVADYAGFADQSEKYVTTELPVNTELGQITFDAAEEASLSPEGAMKPSAVQEESDSISATAGVLRSLRKRFGGATDQWVSRSLEDEAAPGVSVQQMPGASAKDVAMSYQLKAMALPNNVLFSGNKLPVNDEVTRRDFAKDFARDFWSTTFNNPARKHVLKEISGREYSMLWMRDVPMKMLEDLAEFMMRPSVSDSVRARVWSAIARGTSTDPGVTASTIGDFNWHLLHDEWRTVVGKDIASKFLTNARFNPVGFESGFQSHKSFSHNDAIYRSYGAASPALRDNILSTMGIMDLGVTGNRGNTGFKSRMIALEERFRKLSEPLGAYAGGYVRSTLAGYLTQYAKSATEQESVGKMVDEIKKGYNNLLANGKEALGSYNLRHVYRKEMNRMLPLAEEFAAGLTSRTEYENAINALLSPQENSWLGGVRDMFSEIRPAMEVAARLLGRPMGSFENYIPMMNGRISHDQGSFIDNMFRPVGEKVGTSRARSANKRFSQGPDDVQYMLDMHGGRMLGMLRRDMFMLETVNGGLLLHEVLGTVNDGGGRYKGQIEKMGEAHLSGLDFAKLNVTLGGLRGTYDRTRTGFQSGINIDNRTRRILNTAQQVGAFTTLAAVEQLWKQTGPGFVVYVGRMVAGIGAGEIRHARLGGNPGVQHLKAFMSTVGSLTPGMGQLRKNMHSLLVKHAPALYLRGTDGNAAFKERLSLELKERFGDAPFLKVALDHALALPVAAIRGISRTGLELTTGKADSLLADRIFYTEYARRAQAAGFGFRAAFDPSNWNPSWARQAKAATEEIVGTSSLEERGTWMQMKGTTVAQEFGATIVRAYGSHNISLAAHARALGNEFQYGTGRQRLVASAKLAEIAIQQALFNALSKPLRDLGIAFVVSSFTGDDQKDIYSWLLKNVPWEAQPKPVNSGYDYLQTRGWKTLFDSTPALGAYGSFLSLPVVNDLMREMISEGVLKPKTAQLAGEKYKPFQKTYYDLFVSSLGYTGGLLERGTDVYSTAANGAPAWKTALSAVATRDLAGRIFSEYKMKKGAEKKAVSTW